MNARCDNCKAPCDYNLLGDKYIGWHRLKLFFRRDDSPVEQEYILCPRCSGRPFTIKELLFEKPAQPWKPPLPDFNYPCPSQSSSELKQYDLLVNQTSAKPVAEVIKAAKNQFKAEGFSQDKIIVDYPNHKFKVGDKVAIKGGVKLPPTEGTPSVIIHDLGVIFSRHKYPWYMVKIESDKFLFPMYLMLGECILSLANDPKFKTGDKVYDKVSKKTGVINDRLGDINEVLFEGLLQPFYFYDHELDPQVDWGTPPKVDVTVTVSDPKPLEHLHINHDFSLLDGYAVKENEETTNTVQQLMEVGKKLEQTGELQHPVPFPFYRTERRTLMLKDDLKMKIRQQGFTPGTRITFEAQHVGLNGETQHPVKHGKILKKIHDSQPAVSACYQIVLDGEKESQFAYEDELDYALAPRKLDEIQEKLDPVPHMTVEQLKDGARYQDKFSPGKVLYWQNVPVSIIRMIEDKSPMPALYEVKMEKVNGEYSIHRVYEDDLS